VTNALYGDLYFHRFSRLSGATDFAATRPAFPGDVAKPARAVEMRVLRLAEVGQGVSHNFPVSEYGGAVPLAWHCRADCVRKADEVFFAHRVSPCVCLCVFVSLQRQKQEADGEDHKNGEDFAAEGESVFHGVN